MAGYVTTSRTLPHHLMPGSIEVPGVPVNFFKATAASNGQFPDQVTTSYRSGVAEDIRSLRAEAQSTSWAEASRGIRSSELLDGEQSKYDTGHTFSTTLRTFTCDSSKVGLLTNHSSIGKIQYAGPLVFDSVVYGRTVNWPGMPATPDLGWYGRTAISSTIPTRSVSNLAISLGELLKDGLPSIPGRLLAASRGPRGLGREHLNMEFALLPLINDIKRTAHAVLKSGNLIRQYERDSGRNVRRRRTFPLETTTEIILPFQGNGSGRIRNPTSLGTAGFYEQFGNNGYGSISLSRKTTRKIWFSGAYTYYLPSVEDNSDFLRVLHGYEEKADYLLGIRLTPELLWELAPWSWFIDWHFSIQTTIRNLTLLGQDDLVMRWGYLMCTSTTEDTWTLRGVTTYHNRKLPDLTTVFTCKRKERVKASPYGFGLNPNSFTGRQWAILAALGMTKSPRALR